MGSALITQARLRHWTWNLLTITSSRLCCLPPRSDDYVVMPVLLPRSQTRTAVGSSPMFTGFGGRDCLWKIGVRFLSSINNSLPLPPPPLPSPHTHFRESAAQTEALNSFLAARQLGDGSDNFHAVCHVFVYRQGGFPIQAKDLPSHRGPRTRVGDNARRKHDCPPLRGYRRGKRGCTRGQ